MIRITSAAAILLFLLIFYLLTYPSFSSITLSPLTIFLPTPTIKYTAFIPFVPNPLFSPNNLSWTNAVRVPWCLDHQAYCYTGTLDTGSTGVILSAADLTDYDRFSAFLFPVGWQFLTSSKILYVGNWIPRNLTFPTGFGAGSASSTNITARVPILAVTKKIICPGYNITKDGPECRSNGTETDMPVHIVYLGIGFGRQYNGQLQGNPDKNPFLNIIAINDGPVSSTQMHAGYTITNEGVHVGLTEGNSGGFEKVKLEKQTRYSSDGKDWTQTGSCITVGKNISSSPLCVNATMLVDTGVEQAYLTIPPSIPVTRVREESASRPGSNVSVLADNQTVTVHFGSQSLKDDDFLGYRFVVGDAVDNVVPIQVITTVSNVTAPFVNTGRHFLRRYDVLFDAKDGWYGVRIKR